MSDKPTFRAMGVKETPMKRLDRRAARTGYRVFRSPADGFEAAIPVSLIERAEYIGRAAAPNEWAARLVGQVAEDAQGFHVIVLGLVLHAAASASPGYVETSHADEAEVRSLCERLFPDGVQVGWMHGHVDHGARFSETDKATQRRWKAPYALGVVVDPFNAIAIGVYRGPEAELLTPVFAEAPSSASTKALRTGSCVATCDGRSFERFRGRRARRSFLAAAGLTVLFLGGMILRRSRRDDERLVVVGRREEELEHRVHVLEERRCLPILPERVMRETSERPSGSTSGTVPSPANTSGPLGSRTPASGRGKSRP